MKWYKSQNLCDLIRRGIVLNVLRTNSTIVYPVYQWTTKRSTYIYHFRKFCNRFFKQSGVLRERLLKLKNLRWSIEKIFGGGAPRYIFLISKTRL